jgi:chromosome segregation ATPase
VKQYIELRCPSCQHTLRVRDEYLGKGIVCRYCHRAFEAGGPAAVSPAGPSQAEVAAATPSPRAARPAVELSCPSCHHGLRVREEYLGKGIVCRYCAHSFVAQTPAGVSPAVPSQAEVAAEAERQRAARLEEELQQLRGELAAQAAAAGDVRQARKEVTHLRGQLDALHREADADHARHRQEANGLQQGLAAARADAERLREQVAALQGHEGRANEAEARLEAGEGELARLRDELAAAQASGQALTERLAAAEARAGDLDAVRAERDELTRRAEEGAQQAEQFRARVGELERAHAEVTAAHGELARTREEERSRWEAERLALHGHVEEGRRLQSEEIEERLRAEQARADAERQQIQEQLEAHQREFAEQRAALQHEAERSRTEAAELRREHEATLWEFATATQERDQGAAALQEAEQRHRAEAERLTRALEEGRGEGGAVAEERDRLAEQAQALSAELATLRAALQQARDELATQATGHGTAQEELRRTGEEAARLREHAEALQRHAEEARAAGDETAAGLRQELAGARADADWVRARVAELEAQAARAAQAEAELQAAREAVARLEQAVSVQQQALASVHREAEHLREQVAALEEHAAQVAELEVELQAARDETSQLEAHLADTWAPAEPAPAEPPPHEVSALQSERDQLAAQIQALRAELEQLHGGADLVLQKALEGACADAASPFPEFGSGHGFGGGSADAQHWRGQLEAALHDFNRERGALQQQLQRLWQENNQMRQLLASRGIHLMPVSMNPNPS